MNILNNININDPFVSDHNRIDARSLDISDKNIETAKKIITSEVEKAGYQVERIILFGSRARGDYNEDSDWDFFAVIDRELLKEDRKIIKSNIRDEMRRNGISADVIIKSVGLYEHQKRIPDFFLIT